jgi:hypothetical protein
LVNTVDHGIILKISHFCTHFCCKDTENVFPSHWELASGDKTYTDPFVSVNAMAYMSLLGRVDCSVKFVHLVSDIFLFDSIVLFSMMRVIFAAFQVLEHLNVFSPDDLEGAVATLQQVSFT